MATPPLRLRLPMKVDLFTAMGRTSAAVLGGYAFSWGLAAVGIASLVALGMDFHEAEKAMMLITVLVFLGAFLWAFAAASLVRVWVVLGGGACTMAGAAWALQRAVLS